MRIRGTLLVMLMVALGTPTGLPAETAEPDRVKVQHVLVSFKGRLRGRFVDRRKPEALQRANEVLALAREGRPFGGLVKEYTDDSFPGILEIVNRGVEPRPGEHKRFDLARSFGDVAFALEVGEIGIAQYHATRSPFGWHIVKRLE